MISLAVVACGCGFPSDGTSATTSLTTETSTGVPREVDEFVLLTQEQLDTFIGMSEDSAQQRATEMGLTSQVDKTGGQEIDTAYFPGRIVFSVVDGVVVGANQG